VSGSSVIPGRGESAVELLTSHKKEAARRLPHGSSQTNGGRFTQNGERYAPLQS
jgi:hypothetical protein